MKKYICYFILLLCIFLCSCVDNREKNDDNKYALKVLCCFDNNDSQALENMFSEFARSKYNINRDVESVMDFYDGKLINYEIKCSTLSSSYDKNGILDKQVKCNINKILTDSGHIYELEIYIYTICKEDPNIIGIDKIKVTDESGKSISIGRE